MPAFNNINGKYLVKSENFRHDLSNKYVDIYNINELKTGKKFILKILKYNKFLLNLTTIKTFSNFNIELLQTPVDYGIITTEPDQEQNFALVFAPAPELTLGMLIEQGHNFTDTTIFGSILKPIAKILQILHSKNIIHGNINADNILINNDGQIILKECISTPTGTGQKDSYQKLNAIYENGVVANCGIDYHALGVLCLELILGKRVYHTSTKNRLLHGDYQDLVNQNILTGTLNDIIQYLLHDNYIQRLDLSDLSTYSQQTKHYSNNLFTEPITLDNKTYINFKEYLLHFYNSTQNKRLSLIIYKLKHNNNLCQAQHSELEALYEKCINSREILKIDLHEQMLLATFINVITNSTFYKLNELIISFDKYSVSQILHQISLEYKFNYVKEFKDFIRFNILIQNKDCKDIFSKYESFFTAPLDNNFQYKLAYILYDLNPDLFLKKNITIFNSLEEFMTSMNSSLIDITDLINDSKLFGYMVSKLQYIHVFDTETYIKHLSSPDQHLIKVLKLFALTQKRYEIYDLKYLTRVLSEETIKKIIPNFHSKILQNDLKNKLIATSEEGDIQSILNTIMVEEIWVQDKLYMEKSLRNIENIKDKLANLKNHEDQALILSLNYTMLISYLLFVFIMIYICYRLYI